MTFQPIQEPYVALRTKALESLLVEKGLLTADDIDRRIAYYEHEIGPMTGARIVARAWTDPGYRELLLEEGHLVVGQLEPCQSCDMQHFIPGDRHRVILAESSSLAHGPLHTKGPSRSPPPQTSVPKS